MTAATEPFTRFADLLDRAREAGIRNWNAMTLATVDRDGQPSTRQVLLKGFDDRGLVFYTNLESRKGRDLAGSPKVALSFYWRELDRQVNIQGTASPVGDAEADEYFASRDRGSRLGAWASRQSRPLDSRARLLAEVAAVEARYVGREVPRPPFWSGFRVLPQRFDFWRAGRFRLHDREIWEREGDGSGWRSWRAYP